MFARFTLAALLAATILFLTGCPTGPIPPGGGTSYDNGFNVGFARDDWYFSGYDDSWFTKDDSPVYYQGDTIPFYDDDTYTAGFWDGVAYAYEDGYFVAYRFAFIIGFSEGYDNAFYPDYLDFLANDVHVEFLNGGFGDGYNDGFSEGRILGANDFESGLPFDWFDAFLFWQEGTDDIYFEEIDLGTGGFGPVVLYTHPYAEGKSSKRIASTAAVRMTMRGATAEKQSDDDYIRPLNDEQAADLDVTPSNSLRNNRELRLDTTWLDRVNTAENTKSLPTPRARVFTPQ